MKKLVALLLMCCGAVPATTAASTPPKYQSSLHVLWEGIKDSKPYLVEEALHNKVNLNVRFGPYNDTPLMMALRIYGRHLQDRIYSVPMQRASPVRKIAGSFFSALLVTGIASFFCSNKYTLGLTFTMTYGLLLTILSIPTSHTTPAKVVDILIRNDLNINARNKEGLTALDILRSYYTYAYQLQDESWYKFLALLIFKSGKDNVHDAWGDIEDEIEKYRAIPADN